MTQRKKLGLVATSILASLAMVAWAPGAPAPAPAKDAVNLEDSLRDLEIEMSAIAEHAAKLEQMVDWPEHYTRHSHQYEWLRIQSKFNEVGDDIPVIQKAEALPPWKAQAIDEIAGLMKAMQMHVESGMATLNETTAVERLYTHDTYALRATAVRFYANHIDGIVDYINRRTTQMTS